MRDTLWILAIAFISSMGFAFMFNMPKRWLVPSSLGGLLTWLLYLLLEGVFPQSVFAPCFIASIFAGLWAHLLAHISRTPFGMYFMIAVVPLIPGSGLYYTIFNLAQSNTHAASHYAHLTTTFALAIACGISVVWGGIEICRKWKAERGAHEQA